MARYDVVYEQLAERAIRQGILDVEAFVQSMINAGASPQAISDALSDDFENNGPIFGRFIRQIRNAAEQSTAAAARQGEMTASIMANVNLAEELIALGTEAINEADAEVLDAIEAEVGADIDFTWIATFQDTCHRCLPLHGVTRTIEEWRLAGYSPDSIHGDWTSKCKCRLVPASETDGQELTEPLRRIKLTKQEREELRKSGVKRMTTRGIASTDLATAERNRDEALKSPVGRRILRRLGNLERARP